MYMGADTVAPGLGYPDTGAGYYSKKLDYKDWYTFNCAQRIHSNSIEHLSWLMPLLFVGGIFQPRFTSCMGAVVIVGREFYRWGYLSKDGPNSLIREVGAIPLNVAEILLIGGLGSLYYRMRYHGLLRNRKLYKKLFQNKIDGHLIEVKKEIENNKNAEIRNWRNNRSLLPMHPLIMKSS